MQAGNIIMQSNNNKTKYPWIHRADNLLHLAEQMEDIRENQCNPPPQKKM